MGQILIRNLDDHALERLKVRAGERNVPLERFVRDALHDLARPTRDELLVQAKVLREKVGLLPDDSTDLIREDRDNR